MIYNHLKSIILIALISFSLTAQEYEKYDGAWNAVFFDHGLSDKFSLRSEFHFRTVSFLDVWNQQIFRPSITYTASKNIKWTVGYSFIKNFDPLYALQDDDGAGKRALARRAYQSFGFGND